MSRTSLQLMAVLCCWALPPEGVRAGQASSCGEITADLSLTGCLILCTSASQEGVRAGQAPGRGEPQPEGAGGGRLAGLLRC